MFYSGQIDEISAWLLIEVLYFSCWLYSGIIFLIFAYSTGMRAFMTSTTEIENDDNPWNNRDTEDFLKHLKREYFNICYSLAFFIMEIILAFTDFAGM